MQILLFQLLSYQRHYYHLTVTVSTMSHSTNKQRKRQKAAHQPIATKSTKNKLTLLEVTDILDDLDLPNSTVWIEPPHPTNGFDTDEDDAPDESGGFQLASSLFP